jgi:large subunit ribosomal protein L15
MKLHSMYVPRNARKDSKRVGRGEGSGRGKTSGRGHKGQMARSGATRRPAFEGGQTPLQRRIPKRGFKNVNRAAYQVVNVSDLAGMKETEITADVLRNHHLIKTIRRSVKLLGDGEVARACTVKVNAVSAAAREKIEKAGGKIELIKETAGE